MFDRFGVEVTLVKEWSLRLGQELTVQIDSEFEAFWTIQLSLQKHGIVLGRILRNLARFGN
jgi:hypothetical protein